MRDEAPEMFREMQKRALAGVGGRANAVKVNCLQCTGWKMAEVAECRVLDCAMWHFRPYQRKQAKKWGGSGEEEGQE